MLKILTTYIKNDYIPIATWHFPLFYPSSVMNASQDENLRILKIKNIANETLSTGAIRLWHSHRRGQGHFVDYITFKQ